MDASAKKEQYLKIINDYLKEKDRIFKDYLQNIKKAKNQMIKNIEKKSRVEEEETLKKLTQELN